MCRISCSFISAIFSSCDSCKFILFTVLLFVSDVCVICVANVKFDMFLSFAEVF